MKSVYDIIKRPVISEKSTALAEIANRYVFEVNPMAKKEEIRDAIQKLFDVTVKKVRTMNVHGKVKYMGRSISKRPNRKKAIITLGEGQKIDFFQTKA